jgi:hypothetical protein
MASSGQYDEGQTLLMRRFANLIARADELIE